MNWDLEILTSTKGSGEEGPMPIECFENCSDFTYTAHALQLIYEKNVPMQYFLPRLLVFVFLFLFKGQVRWRIDLDSVVAHN